MTAGPHDGTLRLADGFPPASRDQWRALVEKVLKGADFEKRMVSRTADGLRIEPIYARADALPDAERAVPGSRPFTRGFRPGRAGQAWDIRSFTTGADPATVNREILDDLQGGVTSVALHVGERHLPLEAAALERAIDGVMLDLCGVSLIAWEETPRAAALMVDLWRKHAVPEAARRGHFNADPLGYLAISGGLGEPIEAALARNVKLIETAAGMPGVTALVADGNAYHCGGATEAQELAALLATLVAYLRAAEAAGIPPATALPKIALALGADTDQFLTIAKLRAARRLVARVAEAAGAEAEVPALHLTAVTSWRMMAKRDPWTNILRTTVACTGAALGGADAILVLPFTFALGDPDPFARRIARNIQIVCQEESYLGRVADPAGGSWYVERLTNDLSSKAWQLFQTIEAKGGMAEALTSGFLQAEIAKAVEARAKTLATGRSHLTGVSAFPLLGDDGVTFTPRAPGSPPSRKRAVEVAPLDMRRLAEPFEALRDAADAHAAATGKPLKVFLASLGQVIDHNVRSTWTKNYLAAGGIAADMSDGYASAEAAAAAFKASGDTAACLCSSDARYAELAEPAARALKAAGARVILMAGRPGEAEQRLRAAGVDQFLFAGQNAVETLAALQEKLR